VPGHDHRTQLPVRTGEPHVKDAADRAAHPHMWMRAGERLRELLPILPRGVQAVQMDRA
jgi:hypothetical protein